MKTSLQKKVGIYRYFSRVLLVQIIPFVLMLVVSSWLTLQAGQMMDQQRGELLTKGTETAQVAFF